MPSAELTITPSEATQLFEEKVTRLRSEMGQAQRASQEAVSQRDKALHEVTTLQQEKARLAQDLEQAKADKQRILDSLAETRKNVEVSLAKQEAKANETITRASEAEAKASAQMNAVRQLKSQVLGVKQSLRAEIDALCVDVQAAAKKFNEALAGIPD